MEATKTLKELESELKSEKKKFDKLQKRLKKCSPNSYEYENLYDEVDALHEDILQLQLLIQEERRKKKREQEMQELMKEAWMSLYSEILKSSKRDLYATDYVSIPVNHEDVHIILNLLDESGNYQLYDEIVNFLNDEYHLNLENSNQFNNEIPN